MTDEQQDISQVNNPENNSEEVKESHIALSSIRRIMKEQGIQKISKGALEEVQIMVEDVIKMSAQQVIKALDYRGAKTVKRKDVVFITQQ